LKAGKRIETPSLAFLKYGRTTYDCYQNYTPNWYANVDVGRHVVTSPLKRNHNLIKESKIYISQRILFHPVEVNVN
jgi:hypothetical protein